MTAKINRKLLEQAQFDSGALGPLAAIVHRASSPGTYLGTVLLNDRRVGTFRLQISDAHAAHQVNIDLAGFRGNRIGPFTARPDAAVVFYVSQGSGGYAVTMHLEEGRARKPVFDSRELDGDDLFATTLLQPGTYQVSAKRTLLQRRVQVAAVKPRQDSRHTLPRPALMAMDVEAEQDAERSLDSGQTQVFRMKGQSRIQVKLVEQAAGEPGDGGSASRKARWRKARRP